MTNPTDQELVDTIKASTGMTDDQVWDMIRAIADDKERSSMQTELTWTDGAPNYASGEDSDQWTIVNGDPVKVAFDAIGGVWWIDTVEIPVLSRSYSTREAAKEAVSWMAEKVPA